MAMSAGRRMRLKEKAEREARIEYVRSASYRRTEVRPFLEANWDEAAQKYIETGDESLKELFPRPRL